MAGPGFFFPTDFSQPAVQTNTSAEKEKEKDLVVFNPGGTKMIFDFNFTFKFSTYRPTIPRTWVFTTS